MSNVNKKFLQAFWDLNFSLELYSYKYRYSFVQSWEMKVIFFPRVTRRFDGVADFKLSLQKQIWSWRQGNLGRENCINKATEIEKMSAIFGAVSYELGMLTGRWWKGGPDSWVKDRLLWTVNVRLRNLIYSAGDADWVKYFQYNDDMIRTVP